jgi:LacI family transcriptional regulator
VRTTPGAARLTDVARRAGVGTSIVSRVLNGDPTVSIRPDTRERILEAARELNYRPNALARGLRLARSMTVGLIVNVAYHDEVAEILVAAERESARAGYVTLIADTNDFVGRGEAYGRLLFERRVDGLLIASVLVNDEFVGELEHDGLPFVLLNRRLQGVGSSVSVDDALGVRTAVDHLVALGHRRIGYLAGAISADIGPVSTDPLRRRLAGFHSGMKVAGLRIPERYVVPSWVDPEAVYEAMQRLLGEEPRPTGVVVWSPTAALPALAAVRSSGLHIPEELSVIAYHDSPIAGYLGPPLTTIRMPLDEMARVGVQCLLGVADGQRPRNVVVHTPPVLVERASTAPARG